MPTSTEKPRDYYNQRDQEISDNLSYAAILKAAVEIIQRANFLGPVESNNGFTVNGVPLEGGGGSAHVIENEGTPLAARSNMNFVGDGVTAADAGGKTVVTVPGAPVTTVNSAAGDVVLDSDDIDDTGKAHRFATAAQLAKVDNIAVTQPVDLDQIESDTVTNNAKVSNATHTGEVTGATALTVAAAAITNRSAVTPAGADHALIYDASGTILAKALLSLWPMTRQVATVTDGATVTIDCSTAYNGIFKLTMAGNRTIEAPTGSPIDGQTMEVWFIQDATGSRVPTFNSVFKFNGIGGTPTLTTTANAVDILCFQYYAATAVWMCTTKVLSAAT